MRYVHAHTVPYSESFLDGYLHLQKKRKQIQALICNVVKGQVCYYYTRTATLKLQDSISRSGKKHTLLLN